jgi:hypothetical protein
MAYPIAHLLQTRKIPFVFMTGYGAETIAAPFLGVRILQKPLEREMLRELFVADVREPPPRERRPPGLSMSLTASKPEVPSAS